VVFAADGDAHALVALAGLSSDRNSLIDDAGKWHGSQIPAAWSRGPFRLAAVAGGEEEKLVLCLDDTSPQLSETEGLPLFDETGAPTPLIADASSVLSKFETSLRHTRLLCKMLKELGLLVPWDLDMPQASGKKIQLKGLFRVDEPKIATLSGDDLVSLRNAGGLALIYAHLLSLSKIGVLARISEQIAARDRQRQAVSANKLDLDRAFGIVEDDPFIF
jgi:hypothetical protein